MGTKPSARTMVAQFTGAHLPTQINLNLSMDK